MSDYIEGGGTRLDWVAKPGDSALVWSFTDANGDPTDETGSWEAVIRCREGHPLVALTISVDDTDADAGSITTSWDESAAYTLLGTASKWEGWYSIAKDGAEEFCGNFTFVQQGARTLGGGAV